MMTMKVGILGAGTIAEKLSYAIQHLEEVEAYAVASRDRARSESFAAKWGFEKAYGSYEEMLADPQVDLVYVATPHSFHYEHTKLCLERGKAVLCEKPMTVNARQAQELFDLASRKQLFLCEAMWTRFLPFVERLQELLRDGSIGIPKTMIAKFCPGVCDAPRMVEPSLAGGALLDLGVYTLTMASLIFGDDYSGCVSAAVKTDKGVDEQNCITLTYPDGKMAILHSSMVSKEEIAVTVDGTNGRLILDNVFQCQQIQHYDNQDRLLNTYEFPHNINGYECELLACRKALLEGERECPQNTHRQTMHIMELMDALRREWGVVYPLLYEDEPIENQA